MYIHYTYKKNTHQPKIHSKTVLPITPTQLCYCVVVVEILPMDQSLQHTASSKESSHEDMDELKSAEATWSDNNSGGFDCNICLDLVQDPVVTFCGHLYCWPCIYKWLQSDKASSEDPNKQHQCPICKSGISQNTLIPLYAGVQSGKPSKCTDLGLVIPQRPPGPHYGAHTQTTSSSTGSHPTQPQLQHHGGYLGYYSPSPAFGFAGTTTFHPMIGMFGEMIHARLSGNPQAAVYTYPSAYSSGSTASSSGRDRRIVMQAEKSLSRVSFFLFCCIMLCLLLF